MPQEENTLPETGRYRAFRSRDYRYYFIGQGVSLIGTQMQIVAINWHIYLLTHTAISLGLIGLSRFVPIVFFALFGGLFADTFNRKRLLLMTQTILAVLSAILAYATLTHTVSSFIIYMVTIFAAIATSFDAPSRQAFVPSLVKREDLANALSLNTIMMQTASILGPALSGFILARFGVGSIYVINALSFIGVIIALFAITAKGDIQGVGSSLSFSALKEGILFVRQTTMIWSTMILDFFSTFFASATTLLPIFATRILHVGPEELGLLYAAPAIGAVLAGFAVAHVRKIRRQGVVLLLAVCLYAIATIIFGFSKLFFVSFGALFLIGAGDSVSTIIRNTVRQLQTPDSLRGRMTGINMIFFMGGPQLGEFEAGVVAQAFGGPVSVVIGGVGTLLVVMLMTYGVPVLRKYEGA